MKIKWYVLITCIFFALGVWESGAHAENIRKPVAAGKFYPKEKKYLLRAIETYMDSAKPASGERPVAIISPHAGYIYSGQICADAFNQAAGFNYDLVVILGTNHTVGGFSKVSIYSQGGYETPLGIAKIDGQTAGELIAMDEAFIFRELVHQREHSVEVLVPYIQVLFPQAMILPAVVGQKNPDVCRRFGKALASVLSGQKDLNALIVASSDLSHYPSYSDAVRVDHATLKAICGLDPEYVQKTLHKQMNDGIVNLKTCACGEAPILAAMAAAENLGANCARLVSYANSGDIAIGSRDQVVGYGAVSFFKTNTCKKIEISEDPMESKYGKLNSKEQETLLNIARMSIEQLLSCRIIPLVRDVPTALKSHRGAFVTLKKNGHLRGCMGHMAQDRPLGQVVSSMALQAAFNDRRFTPVTYPEVPDIEIEISVLTPFKRVKNPQEIIVGRDGVVLEKDGKKAVFLPQVAVEQGWNREEMLDHLCRKAGLSDGSWRHKSKFYTFQAQVFSESKIRYH